jgi:hypothetical protein
MGALIVLDIVAAVAAGEGGVGEKEMGGQKEEDKGRRGGGKGRSREEWKAGRRVARGVKKKG